MRSSSTSSLLAIFGTFPENPRFAQNSLDLDRLWLLDPTSCGDWQIIESERAKARGWRAEEAIAKMLEKAWEGEEVGVASGVSSGEGGETCNG